MSQVSVTPLTLDQVRLLVRDEKSVWVMNYTDKGNQRNRGTLHITAQDENGTSFAITIPNTWIPINLSEYGSVSQLLKSNSFLETFRKRDLIFIGEEEATRLLRSAEAQAEKKKVDLKYNSNVANSASAEKVAISAVSSINENMMPSESPQGDKTAATHSDRLLMSLVERLNATAISPEDALNELNAINPLPSVNFIQDALMNVQVTTTDFYRRLIAIQEEAGQGKLPDNFLGSEQTATA